jgi:4-diphosphocytidyl-2-C-methyl-D-erythritol kinase
VKKSPARVEVWGAAKVNIGWSVGDRRPDGYHDVCGNLHTISLTDRLEISVDDQGEVPVRVSVPGHHALEGPSNLVCAAALVLAERVDAKPTSVVVHKSIPVAAGLGGGSADAAAALVGLNVAWGAGRSASELVSLGAEVGSDVPGILLGGMVHVTGRGERVRSLGAATEGFFVLGIGPETIATKDAYASNARSDGRAFHHNDLEAAACSLVPELGPRLDAMRRAAGIAFVAGSGPTVVGVTADEAHARDVVARVRDHFADVILAQPISWGVRLKVGP